MKRIAMIFAAVAAMAATACSSDGGKVPESEILATVGKSTLTISELQAHMPGGLGNEDSVKFARAYIRQWLDSRLITEVAASEIDMTEIDRLVDSYREDLIMWEYTSRMYDASHPEEIPEDSIRSYYDSHKNEFVLDGPMVKGLYLKVPDNLPSIPELRRLYRSNKPDDIDKIEKSVLNSAVHYDYFRDKWVDWEQIESLIPYDCGQSADKFLSSHSNIDFTQGGFTYLLDIDHVLHTGQPMPYEVAKLLIADRMKFHDRRIYDSQLRRELYEKSLANGKIRLNCEIE